MSSDYFPLEIRGNSWEFENGEGTRVSLVSFGSAIKGDRECYLIERNYSPEYWYEDSKELSRYQVEYYDFGGERIVLASQWMRHLELPLLRANSWEDTLHVAEFVSGEKVERRIVSCGKIEAIESVEVPTGQFNQCYRIRLERLRETLVNSFLIESDTILIYEWYAPNIGLVKFSQNGDVYKLIRVTIHQ